ncbi:protein kinase domain-containing protein [Prosthecomicrobium sp. N25]|uniref:protein kinase domain-containing protein n=1 Tax=Prosthecomicrobium sp. N25 TaxID=3129254 RepID=UPI003077C240
MNDRAYPYALPLGTDISGYVIDKVIGAGGFGITYRATNPVTGVTVAVKEFYPQGFASRQNNTVILHSDVSSGSYETALKKFEQEAAKLTGRYRHPHIVRGLNFLRMNNTAYFIMDFIEGKSFDQWLLERSSPPGEAELRPIFDKVLDAVDYIHANNGMHRDLTPRNIMISDIGEPILVDFGAAGEGLDTDRFNSTAFAQPNYAPPEQLAAEDSRMQGRHTDIFSLGGVLYRAVVGRPPVKPLKRSHDVALNGRDHDPYVPAGEAAREPLLYSAVFLEGIDHALKLDPRDRPATIAEFRATLGWLDDATMVVPSRPVAAGDGAEDATRLIDVHDMALPPPRRPTGPTGGGESVGIVPRMEHLDDAATSAAPAIVLAPDELRPAARGWGRLVAALLVLVLTAGGVWAYLAGVVGPGPGPKTVVQRPVAERPVTERPLAERTDPPAGGAGRTTDAPPRPADAGAGGSGGAPPPPPANWTEFGHVALAGRDLSTVAATGGGTEACKAACRADQACDGFTLAGGQCRLVADVAGVQPESGATSAVRSGTAAVGTVRGAIETESRRRGQFRTLEGMTLIGAGSPRAVANQAQCAYACQSDAQCKAWTYMSLVNACRLVREVDAAAAGPGVGFVTGVEDPDGKLSEAIRRTVTAKTRTAQAFLGADLVGRVIARERSADGNACRQSCLSNQSCIAAVQAEGECQLLGQVDDIRRRADAEVFVDVRQTALVGRIDSALRERVPPTEANRGQAEFFAGFDVIGAVLPSDRARSAATPEDCQAVCTDTNGCVAYSFSGGDRRCQILASAVDVVPDQSRVSGVYRGVAQPVVDLARRRLVQSEQARPNYRDLPPNCAPEGQGSTVALGSQPNPEQCAFLCRSGQSCQGWVYSRADRSCQLLASVTGATALPNSVAGLFDPTGRRASDIARACGPVPPAAIGGGAAAATDCDRLAGYLYDSDLPKGVAPKQFEHIDPSRAVPACLAVLANSPGTARWRLALGRALERDGREAEARAAYREAAEGGSGAAAFLYGIMADKGQGGPEDDLEAERAYKLARSRGVTAAGTALALLYTYSEKATTNNDQEILGLLTDAANRGHAPAMYRLGEALERGKLNRRFINPDPAQASLWYGKAFQAFSRDAEQRDPTAMRFLSLLYDGGRGVPRNVDLAVRYLTQYLQIAYGPDNLVVRRRGAIGDVGLEEWSLDTRKAFQQFLRQVAGFDDVVDGIIGGRSREAMERWLSIRT